MRKCSLTSSLILFKRGQKINLRLGVAAARALARVYYIFLPATAALSSKAARRPPPFLLDVYLPKIRGVQYFPAPTAKNQPAENWSLKNAFIYTPTCLCAARVPLRRVSIWCLCMRGDIRRALYGGLNLYYVSVI